MTRWWKPAAPSQTVTGSVVFGEIVQIQGVSGDVTVSLDRSPYRVVAADDVRVLVNVRQARAQPSRLLLARHQVVPFAGRTRTLDAMADWARGGEPVAVRLVHAAGGQGKTRLAAEMGAQCATAGWAVWHVTHTPTPGAGAGAVSKVELSGDAVLVVVDYADRWPASALLALLAQLNELHIRAGTRIRVLMLARSDGYWWPALADRADSDLGQQIDQLALLPLALDSVDDRPGLFTSAAERFATALDLEPVDWPVPDLTGDGFAQVLAVHMAALATVDSLRLGETPPARADTASAYLLRREQAYWQQLHSRSEVPSPTTPELMHRTVVAATLTGVQPRAAARRALAEAGFTESSAAADRMIDDHLACYPPADARMVLEPLQPDRLGEDLLGLSTPGHGYNGITNLARDWTPDAITGLLTTAPQSLVWAAEVVTVLVETAHRWPHITTDVLYPLLRTCPQVVLAAGGATVTRLTEIPRLDPAELEVFEPLLPTSWHAELDVAAAAISSALTRHRLAGTTAPAERARLHLSLAVRLARAGRREQAVASLEKAVAIRRRLAEVDPGSHLPDLAHSLTSLGAVLLELGRHEPALVAVEEAVILRRRLADDDPYAHLPALAESLNSEGTLLYLLGRRERALPVTEESVSIRRRAAEADPEDHAVYLAVSLTSLGLILRQLGRPEEALAPIEEALIIRRRLVDADPDVHTFDLATTLTNLGRVLSDLGRPQEGLPPAEEAVTLWRRAAEANPRAHVFYLAASLGVLGMVLARLDQAEQALVATEEAAEIYRKLVEKDPVAYLPDFALSLNNLGAIFSMLGRFDRALVAAEEALGIHRRLATANPDAFLGQLAESLHARSFCLFVMDRTEQALVSVEEAVGIHRRLVDARPNVHLAELAKSLGTLGLILADMDRDEESLVVTEEFLRHLQFLADHSPQAFGDQLSTAQQIAAAIRAKSLS